MTEIKIGTIKNMAFPKMKNKMNEKERNIKVNYCKIKARDVQTAKYILREKYPFSQILVYKFDKDFKFIQKEKRDYKNRLIKIVFIKNIKKIWVEY